MESGLPENGSSPSRVALGDSEVQGMIDILANIAGDLDGVALRKMMEKTMKAQV